MLIRKKDIYSVNKPVTAFKILVKMFFALIMGVFIITSVFYLFTVVKYDDDFDDDDYKRICERQYTDRNFNDLWDTLYVFGPEGEEFDMYYEACEIYDEYMQYCIWTDRDTADKFPDKAAREAQRHLDNLRKYTEKAVNSRNIKVAKELLSLCDI